MEDSMHTSLSSFRLKRRIMRRVYVHWFLKRVAPVLLVQFSVLAVLLAGVHEYVSIKFVSANALRAASSVPSLMVFARSAFTHMEFVSRLLIAASALLGVLVARDILRFWRRALQANDGRQVTFAKNSLSR